MEIGTYSTYLWEIFCIKRSEMIVRCADCIGACILLKGLSACRQKFRWGYVSWEQEPVTGAVVGLRELVVQNA